jgi:hypothetical protein
MTERFGQLTSNAGSTTSAEGVMQSQRDFRSLPIHGYNTQNPDRAGATVIAFQPLGAVRAGPSSSWDAGRSRGAGPSGAPTVIPFRLRRSSPLVQSVLPSTKRTDQTAITDEEEYRQRTFENLLAAAWVGTLMSAAYYMLNVLAAPSVVP